MAEADPPHDGTPLAADDIIGSLAARVRELSLRVAQLEGELEAARRRIAVYEDFDAQVQDSLFAALRAANQVRERARVTAEAIAEEAKAQRPASAIELDAMRIERDALRRAIDDAIATAPRAAATMPATTVPLSEMRSAAADALRGVFKELVAEIRATTPPAVPAPAAAVAPVASVPPPFAPSPIPSAPAAQPAPALREAYSAPPSSYNAEAPERLEPAPLPRPTVVLPQPQPQLSAVVEDVDVAPAAPAPVAPPAPQPSIPPAPQPVAAEPAPQQPWTPAPTEPIGEVQVVLSPISSFPRLVELERRLQGMSVVRTVYARDFRNSVATLAIGLRHPMTVEEFAGAVTKLEYPRLRIVSTSGYVLELRIDTEASSIA